MQKWYYRFGALFFLMASVYMGVLLWKSYVWWQWLHRLDDMLMRSSGGVMI